jgi:tRNA pseudouridine38-40 synthase
MSADVIKLRLTIAYDGTDYAGWQVQPSGTGVQELIERAWSEIIPGQHRLHSSSRTDAGVHAEGMVAHVEFPKDRFRLTMRNVVLALNAKLPPDIRIVSAARAPLKFHARFDASGKQYRYRVWNHCAMNPMLRRYAWQVTRPLGLPAMREAARRLVGTHDFRSFAATHSYEIADTVRTLRRVDIRRSGPLLTFLIEGDGFLYKMCRGIVGTLVQVGLGRFTPLQMVEMLEAKDRRVAGMSAPACGLVLHKVFYGRKSSEANKPDAVDGRVVTSQEVEE